MTRVLHINALEYGGAAIAARRLHDGLLLGGYESRMLVQHAGADTRIEGTELLDRTAFPSLTDPVLDDFFDVVYRTSCAPGDVLFSTDRPTRDLSAHASVQWADVINLHWLAGMLSAPAIAAVQALGKPVVWTLHDQFPFTGGCHYSGTCKGYEGDCAGCPALPPDAGTIPLLVLDQKRRWIDPLRLTAVAPSQWLASRARQSTLLRNADIRVISNSVPVEDFQRHSREEARTMLGLPADAVIILFGADHLGEVRKGYAHLSIALQSLASHSILGPRLARGSAMCVSFGKGRSAAESIPVTHLGELSGARLCAAYRAADVFVLPTLDDNLPNTMLEAVAAGTPVVGYATGGVIEVVKDGGCGLVVERGDVTALSAALADITVDGGRRERLRVLCEEYAHAKLGLATQARAYGRLYDDLLTQPRSRTTPTQFTASQLKGQEAELRTAIRPLEIVVRQGGELLALRAELAKQGAVLQSVHDRWRITRETLHDVERQFQATVERDAEELASVHDRWRVTRETLHDVQQRLEAMTVQAADAHGRMQIEAVHAAAELAVLRKRARRLMKRVAIFGTQEAGRRGWEALAACGTVDLAGFVDDNDLAQGKAFLGSTVHPLSWLNTTHIDLVAIASLHPDHCMQRLAAAGVDSSRVVVLPVTEGVEALTRFVNRRFPDPLLALLSSVPTGVALRLGIFGTGAGAMKVWEALADIDIAETAWFADNNPQQQGQALLWADVIAPHAILTRDFDAVVIGSMARQPIRLQLLELGVRPEQILTPDVQSSVDQIRDQLTVSLRDLTYREVA